MAVGEKKKLVAAIALVPILTLAAAPAIPFIANLVATVADSISIFQFVSKEDAVPTASIRPNEDTEMEKFIEVREFKAQYITRELDQFLSNPDPGIPVELKRIAAHTRDTFVRQYEAHIAAIRQKNFELIHQTNAAIASELARYNASVNKYLEKYKIDRDRGGSPMLEPPFVDSPPVYSIR